MFYPIRALRKYLSRTEQHHPACAELFISAIRRKEQVSESTIMFWISCHSHGSTTVEECGLVKVKAYRVMKIGTSLLFRRNCAVPSLYLRGATHRYMATFSVGSLVAAQEVVSSTSSFRCRCSNSCPGLFATFCD